VAAVELLQAKHNVGVSTGLSDKETDIWKALLVWMNTAQPADPLGPELVLVTTSVAPPGTAAHALRNDVRDVSTAVIKLADAAWSSKADNTRKAREKFLALTEAQRHILMSRVVVADGAPTADELDENLARILWLALPHRNQQLFLAMVWRWWAGVALDMLRGRRGQVGVGEAHAAISHVRDQFSEDNLPATVELADVDAGSVIAVHGEDVFVHQMRWVGCNGTNLRKAIVDYYRAVAQATRWLTEDLIGMRELEKFEDGPACGQRSRRVPSGPRNQARTAPCAPIPARTPSAICPPCAAGNSRTHRDATGRYPAKCNSPRGRETSGHGLFSQVVAGVGFEPT
jgi:ABC-3C protein